MLLRHCIIWIFALSCALATPDLRPGSYQNPDKTIQFQAITEGGNGLLYILDQYSRMYRLSGTLDGSQTAVNVSLPINRLSDPAAMRSQILLTTDRKGEILACNHIGCGLMDSENLSWTHVSLGAGSGNFSHMQPILATGDSNGRFYIASQDTGTSAEESAPILSVHELNIDRVSLTPSKFTIYRQDFGNRLEGKITINQSFRNKHPWKIKPAFLSILPLKPNPFGYLITVQSSLRIHERSFESRLGRFCADDKLLRSYSETTLECHGKGGLYTIAMSGSMIMHKNETFLAVVFGKSAGASWDTFTRTKNVTTTAVCLFSVEEINRRFNEAFDKCRTYTYKNTDDDSKQMTKLPWIVGYDSEGNPARCRANRAPMCQRSTHGNDYIDVKGVLNGRACVESRDIRGLQLLTVGLNSHANSSGSETAMAAIYIDTSELRLIHLNVSADRCGSDLLSTVPTEVTYRQHEFLPSLLTNDSRSYVVLSDNKVQWFPVGCGMHSTCVQCMEASKRMGCGWCESGYCSTKDQCKVSWFNDRCSPVIEDFSPKNGSVHGGTNITIRGQLFGSPNATVAVTVAGLPCPILNRSDSEITCKTNPSSSHGPVEISVTSFEKSTHDFKFGVVGRHHLASPIFSYLVSTVNLISPAFGPKTGNTLLSVTGTNLHIGNTQEIFVAGIPCRIASVNDTVVTCYTGRSENSPKGSVVLLTDGIKTDTANSSIRFEYRGEPIIEQCVLPLRMTLGGHNTFVFNGSNLDSLSVPLTLTIQATTVAGRSFQLSKACFKVEEPRHLKCPAVSLKPGINNIIEIANLSATLTGSELSASIPTFPINICSDPEISTWDEQKPVKFIESQGGQYLVGILQISGRGLNKALTTQDYRIFADEHLCKVTRLDDHEIKCKIQQNNSKLPDDRDFAAVWVTMGNANATRLGAVRFNYPVRQLESKETGSSTLDFTIGMVAVCGFFTVTIVAVAVIFVRQTRKNPTDSSKPFALNNDKETQQLINPDLKKLQTLHEARFTTDLTSFSLTTQQQLEDFRLSKLLISPPFLECGRRLGSGSFGTVYEGRLRAYRDQLAPDAERVAIKVITAISSFDSTKEIIQEASIMKDLRHRHIMKLHGVLVGSPIGTGLVMEFMTNGDLHTYVRNNNISYDKILDFLIQIAEGMGYLSSQKIVHRDLAARNCMLDDELSIRIADFGLSRDLYQDTTYIPRSDTQLPYRWIALECFTGPYSTNSDVWSFGVVMWELFEKGIHPYGEMDPGTLLDWLNKGFRLAQPHNCSEDVYRLMCQCWHASPSERPDFQSLCVHLRALANNLQLSYLYDESLFTLSPRSTVHENDGVFNCTYGAQYSSTSLRCQQL